MSPVPANAHFDVMYRSMPGLSVCLSRRARPGDDDARDERASEEDGKDDDADALCVINEESIVFYYIHR